MRFLPIIFVLTLALVSCSQHTTEPTPATTQASQSFQTVKDEAKAVKVTAEKLGQAPTTQVVRQLLPEMLSGIERIFNASEYGLTQINAMQSELTKAQTTIGKLTADLKTESEKRKVAEDRWKGSWFGGKMWALIYWVAGITTALVLADILLYVFVGVGINPISIALRLLAGLGKK